MRSARPRLPRTSALRRSAPLLLALAVSLACGGCRGRSGAGSALVLAGSTSVQPVAEYVAEFYQDVHPDRVVNVQGGGSTAGVKAALDGAADVGMVSRELKKDEVGLEPVRIALDAVTLIVHPSNGLSGLTKQQAQDIYLGRVTRWSEAPGAGGDASPRARDAITVITREEGSGTRNAFEEGVMDKQDITPRAIVQDSTGTVRAIVAGDPNAIGYISLGMVTPDVKPLDYEGVTPSAASVHDGSYALARPFLLITKGDPTPGAQAFIDYALSPEGQALVARAGFIPVGAAGP